MAYVWLCTDAMLTFTASLGSSFHYDWTLSALTCSQIKTLWSGLKVVDCVDGDSRPDCLVVALSVYMHWGTSWVACTKDCYNIIFSYATIALECNSVIATITTSCSYMSTVNSTLKGLNHWWGQVQDWYLLYHSSKNHGMNIFELIDEFQISIARVQELPSIRCDNNQALYKGVLSYPPKQGCL